MPDSLLHDFRHQTVSLDLCEQVKKQVISELQRIGVTVDLKKLATKIEPVVSRHTTLDLRQYQSSRDQFVRERAADAVRKAKELGITSVEQVTVEIGPDVTIPGYHFVVAFWKN